MLKGEFITRYSWDKYSDTNKKVIEDFDIKCINAARKILDGLEEYEINTAYAYSIYLITYMLVKDRKLLFSKYPWQLVSRLSDSDAALSSFDILDIVPAYTHGIMNENNYRVANYKDIVEKLNEICEEVDSSVRFITVNPRLRDDNDKERVGCGICCRNKKFQNKNITWKRYNKLKPLSPNNRFIHEYNAKAFRDNRNIVDDILMEIILSYSITEYLDPDSRIYKEIKTMNNNFNKISTVNPLLFDDRYLNRPYQINTREGIKEYYGRNMGIVDICNFGFTPYLNSGSYLRLFIDSLSKILSSGKYIILSTRDKWDKCSKLAKYIGYLSTSGKYLYLRADLFIRLESRNKYFDRSVTAAGLYNALFMNNILQGYIKHFDAYRAPIIRMTLYNDTWIKLDFYRLIELFRAYKYKNKDLIKALKIFDQLSNYQYDNDEWVDEEFYYREDKEEKLYHNILWYYGKLNNRPSIFCGRTIRLSVVVRSVRTASTRILDCIDENISLFKHTKFPKPVQPITADSSEEEIEEAVKQASINYADYAKKLKEKEEERRKQALEMYHNYHPFLYVPTIEDIKKSYIIENDDHETIKFYPRSYNVSLCVEYEYLTQPDNSKNSNYITDFPYKLKFRNPKDTLYSRLSYDAQSFFIGVFEKLMTGSIIRYIDDFNNIPNEILKDWNDIINKKIIGYRYTIDSVFMCKNDPNKEMYGISYTSKEFKINTPYEVLCIFPTMFDTISNSGGYYMMIKMLNDMGMLNIECTRSKILRNKGYVKLTNDYMDYDDPNNSMKIFVFLQDKNDIDSNKFTLSPTVNRRSKLRLLEDADISLEKATISNSPIDVFFVDHLGYSKIYFNHYEHDVKGNVVDHQYYVNSICMNSDMFSYVLSLLIKDIKNSYMIQSMYKNILMRSKILSRKFKNDDKLRNLVKKDFPVIDLSDYINPNDYDVFIDNLRKFYNGPDFGENINYFLSKFKDI